MPTAKTRRLVVGGLMTIVGAALFVPARSAAAEAQKTGSCGSDCNLSCCSTQGTMCSCYCDTEGYAVCGCLWQT